MVVGWKGPCGGGRVPFLLSGLRGHRTHDRGRRCVWPAVCWQALGPELTRIESECVAAYVIFEHRKSWERCIVSPSQPVLIGPTCGLMLLLLTTCPLSVRRPVYEQKDYRHHSNRLVLRRPPEALRFRGEHRLIVTEAPEPSNVLWENLEVSAALVTASQPGEGWQSNEGLRRLCVLVDEPVSSRSVRSS